MSHHSYPKVATAHDGLRAQRTVTSTREGVEHVTHGGLRAQKPPLPGKRPGVLLDPEPVQVVDAVTSYVAAPGPSSLVPRLAANDALDNATLKFLGARALLDRREQEEERRKREEEVKMRKKALLERLTAEGRRELEQRLDSGGASSKRKRKRRRKRRTPRTSSLPCRSRRRQRQWSACYAGFTGYVTPRVLFSSVDAMPKMLCIMAGMHQEDSYAVFAGYDAPRAVPSRFHRCSSWTIYWPVVCNDRFSGPGAVLGQVLTCPLLCMTGEVGPDSTKKTWNCRCCSSSKVADVAASCSDSSCSSRAENSRYAQCKLCTFRGDPSGAALGQGCRARCVQRQALVFQTVQKTCRGPSGAAHHHGHPHPRRGAEFDPHGSDCSADHRDSTVAVPRQGVDMPVVGPHRCKLCSFFMAFHRCSSWTRLSCPLCARQMPGSSSSRRAENC